MLRRSLWNIGLGTSQLQHLMLANYLCWAQFSLRFWHFWWVSSLFQWLPTTSKPVLSILLIVGRLYIRISLTTHENTLVARDGEGFTEVAMLLHVLMFWGLLARLAGRSDSPADSAHIASYEKGRCCQAPPCGETGARRHLSCDICSMVQRFFFTLSFMMMTWWYGHIFSLLALCAGNPPVTCGFFAQRANNAELWCFIIPPTQQSCWGYIGFTPTVCPSCIPCPLCIAYSSDWIHFIFIHLIKQLRKVCSV